MSFHYKFQRFKANCAKIEGELILNYVRELQVDWIVF